MPRIDITITISVIVALAAIISPILTAIINNRYQLKIKRIELQQQHYENTSLYKRRIFENYLMGLNSLSRSNNTNENRNLYSQNYPLAYMYLPKEIQNKMSVANELLNNKNRDELAQYVNELSTLIGEVLKSM